MKYEKVHSECKWYPVCPMKYYYESGKLAEKWILNYCKGDWSKCVRYHLENSGQYHPDNMLPDGTIKKNYKFRAVGDHSLTSHNFREELNENLF